MNRLVYLFELDSVRTSRKEIEIAQKAMYDEIMVKGNSLVLSFNQLADSRAFLCALENEKHYDSIVKLFQLDKIKISLFGSYKTASQYIINAVQKSYDHVMAAKIKAEETKTPLIEILKKEKYKFVFSAWPIDQTDTDLMKLIIDSIKFNDLNTLKELLEKKKKSKDKTEAELRQIADLEKIISYVKLIVHIDMSEVPYIRAKQEKGPSLEQYIDKVLTRYLTEMHVVGEHINGQDLPFSHTQLLSAFTEVSRIRNEFLSLDEKGKKGINSRSEWYGKIKEITDNDLKFLVTSIVDMCHNYTTESSISCVSKRYMDIFGDDFWQDFEIQFVQYLSTHRAKKEEASVRIPRWSVAVRFLTPTFKKRFLKNKEKLRCEGSIYSPCRFGQFFNVLRKSLLRVGIIFIYIVLAVFVSPLIDWIESLEIFNAFLPSLLEIKIMGIDITRILLFGLLSSLVEKIFFVHDIIDSIIDFFLLLYDWCYYLIYLIISNKNGIKRYKFIKRGKDPMRRSLKKYYKLRKEKPELFKSEADLPIEFNIKAIKQFMKDTKREIGVVYESPYRMLIVDLIRDEENKRYYAYERVVSLQKGGVVIIPKHKDKLILLKQFRHSLRDFQYSFPRGFGEAGIDPLENAKKELCEELNLKPENIISGKLLGTTVADSGLCGDTVYVYLCEIDAENVEVDKVIEGIKSSTEKTSEELLSMIQKGEITDGFTLSAYSLYSCKNMIQ